MAPKAGLSGLAPSSPLPPCSDPPQPPPHRRLRASALTDPEELPSIPGGHGQPPCPDHGEAADAGRKEHAEAPGQFSTQQETFQVRAKGTTVFKNQKPKHFSWKPTVLPPEGQGQGALPGSAQP